MTVNELETNEKLKYWYAIIMKCKESRMPVKQFCRTNHIGVATYYSYQKKIKEILCENLEEKKDSVEFLPLSIHSESNHDDIITLTKGSVKIEFNCHTGYVMIEPLIRALLC